MDTKGLFFAVQSLLYHYKLIFFRVRQEGFNAEEYERGIQRLLESEFISQLIAVGIPGVGDQLVIEAMEPLFIKHRPVLITTEQDLYDILSPRGLLKN